jgi:hypothetical protein
VLSGKRRMLIAGQFEFQRNKVEVFPFIVGEMVEDPGDLLRAPFSQTVRLFPGRIDQFARMRSQGPIATTELQSLLQVSEDEVKKAFATIIGEPFVPKDWGGEKSDLSTSRLTVDGEQKTAAFIFKGPSVPGEMHPANMGKRGDQLVRAFDEPVDLIVIQHCNKVANTVVRMAEALCCDLQRPRRYCIIDGADTLQILKAYDKLPTGRRKRKVKADLPEQPGHGLLVTPDVNSTRACGSGATVGLRPPPGGAPCWTSERRSSVAGLLPRHGDALVAHTDDIAARLPGLQQQLQGARVCQAHGLGRRTRTQSQRLVRKILPLGLTHPVLAIVFPA